MELQYFITKLIAIIAMYDAVIAAFTLITVNACFNNGYVFVSKTACNTLIFTIYHRIIISALICVILIS